MIIIYSLKSLIPAQMWIFAGFVLVFYDSTLNILGVSGSNKITNINSLCQLGPWEIFHHFLTFNRPNTWSRKEPADESITTTIIGFRPSTAHCTAGGKAPKPNHSLTALKSKFVYINSCDCVQEVEKKTETPLTAPRTPLETWRGPRMHG